MKPENLTRINREIDGEDYDLNALVDFVIDRKADGYQFVNGQGDQDPGEWRRLGKKVRDFTGGEDPDIVFEHTGVQTFAASVFVVSEASVSRKTNVLFIRGLSRVANRSCRLKDLQPQHR